MIGQKRRWQLVPLLLASAALGLAQTSGTPMPNWPSQGATSNRPTAPNEQVGPGTINYTEGSVLLDGQQLTQMTAGPAALKPGQRLDTTQGYAELLLTPGAFFRVGPNSEVQMLSAGLADTRVQLVHGTSILEVDQLIKGTNLSVVAGGATAQVEKNGLYMFDATQQAVMVVQGKAEVQEAAGRQTLGNHDEVLLTSTRPLKKRGFDENLIKAEPLYVWSMARSQAESQVSNYAARNAEAYNVAGPGWFWEPAWGFYGFWPADYALYSPFGWGFYSPAYFGFGFYGGGYYGGGHYLGRYVRTGQYGVASRHVGASAFHSSGFARTMGGGGFHGGGGRR